MRWQVAVSVSLGLLMWVLIGEHVSGVNGPWYWTWEWRELSGGRLYLWMALAAIPFGLAQWLFARARRRPSDRAAIPLGHRVRTTRAAYASLMLASFGLQLAAIAHQVAPPGLDRVTRIIEHPVVTSYFVDAKSFAAEGEGIRDFHDKMWSLSLHGRNKPPGTMLFFIPFRWWLADATAALAAGLALGLLACLAIPATAALIQELTGDSGAGFAGASFLALTPSLVLFFPVFDQLLPILSCLLLVSWTLALRRASSSWAIAFGLLLALALFVSFSFLVLGVFLAGYSVLYIARDPRTRVYVVAAQAGTGLLAVAVVYGILYLAAGFDLVATFNAALENQAALSEKWGRPYPDTIGFDLVDFVLGAGWIALPLAAYALGRAVRGTSRHLLAVVLLCLAQPVVVALLGLIPTETARVWLFMLPLLMVPVGLTLARWNAAPRAAAYLCLWLILVATCQHMSFVVLEDDVLSADRGSSWQQAATLSRRTPHPGRPSAS